MIQPINILAFTLLLACGCGTARPKDQAGKPAAPKRTIRTQVQPPAPVNTPRRPEPAVRPINSISATVREVNPRLRFVILDFGVGKIPQLDQKLGVYRGVDKVGEIKISGPYRGTTVAADVTAGEVKFGDVVKEE